MNNDRSVFLDKIYKLINNERRKYGDFKKCELHIHTPESKCYRFITPYDKLDTEEDLESNSEYTAMSLKEILLYGKEIGFFNEYEYKTILDDISNYEKQEISIELNTEQIKFNSYKEYITYEMIAHKLCKENISIAIVSDHNTIAGYNKLLCAINEYTSRKTIYRKYKLKLFLGVEISCSDRNHLMVIVDSNKKQGLQKHLDEIIMGDNIGSYFDTRTIINRLQVLNPITYIAHANSSHFYGNEVYKKELLTLSNLNGFGIKDVIHKENIVNRTKKYNKSIEGLAYVLEADSHSINELGRKNCWIKLSNMDFNSLKKSFINHRVCICNEKPTKTNIQIKGLVVERGERGFLGSNPESLLDKYMVIDFSSDLNCIIGGRGTGKSTILNLLEIMYSREIDDLELLNFISQHKRIYSVFTINNQEYILDFLPQVELNKSYDLNHKVIKNSYYKKRNIYRLNNDWYYLFKISKGENNIKYIEISKEEVPIILKSVFKRAYNINKLVEKINTDRISEYIREVMAIVNFDEINTYIHNIKKVNNKSLFKFVRESIDDIICMIDRRKTQFEIKVNKFNEENKQVIKIGYSPINNSNEFFEEFLNILTIERKITEITRKSIFTEAERSICKTYLRWGDLQKYLIDAVEKWSYFEVLKMILNNKLHLMNKELPLKNYEGIEEKFSTIDKGFQHIDAKKIKEINKQILYKFSFNKDLFRKSLINCFKVMDSFELFFNVNFKEDSRSLPNNFKNIKNLSSGQKVAALLTFVLNFGVLNNDTTPLIIDQPEDNLDNTYIYKTLVESLKTIKNKRQIIIVTHSSTIVINADAEEVIVLKSDNSKGWIDKHGYPSDKRITKEIINYLEGGRDSFIHKYKMYKTILEI